MNFTKSEIEKMILNAEDDCNIAESILDGEHDNYDGADGARLSVEWNGRIIMLCKFILEGKKLN